MKYQKIIFFIITIAVFQFLLSCTPEKKIAKKFLEKEKYGSILVISPDVLYMTNLKKHEIENPDSLDQYTLDSLLYYNSKYLQYLSDSTFIEKYVNNLLKEFQNLGFDTYTEEYFDVFLSLESPSYILNIAQLELEEDIKTITEDDFSDGWAYHVNIDINTVTVYSWFELSTVNSSEDKKEVLYADHYVSDDVQGYFRESLLFSKVKYEYVIDSLKVDDVYELSTYIGGLYADYVFDYLMNKEIEKQITVKSRLPVYLHYDRIRNKLYPVEESRFTIIE